MPVRGSSRWTHAKVNKVVINLDHGGSRHIYCAWDTCENDGYETNKIVVRDNSPGHESKTITYVFCSERHKQYWINSVRSYGNLPSGAR